MSSFLLLLSPVMLFKVSPEKRIKYNKCEYIKNTISSKFDGFKVMGILLHLLDIFHLFRITNESNMNQYVMEILLKLPTCIMYLLVFNSLLSVA